MTVWEILAIAALIVGAYVLGRYDGRCMQALNDLERRLDRLTKQVEP
jgi:hypothetical protein